VDSDLTVIVSCCQHPYNLRSICQAIRAQTVKPKEIWLHYNGDPGALDRGDLFDEVVCSTGDFKSRFATSLCADTYYSLVCDDDCFLGNKWIENCLKTIERSPGIIGPIGNVLYKDYLVILQHPCEEDVILILQMRNLMLKEPA